MFGVVSMTHPAMMNTPSIIRIIRVGLSVALVIAWTKVSGTSSAASAWASGRAKAMIGTITPFTLAELSNIFGKSSSLSVPWISPIAMVVTTATAAASVGVKTPV